MKETGKVIKKEGELATVEIREGSSCAKCGLCAFSKEGAMTLEARDTAGAAIGDNVEIIIPERDVIISGFLIFIMPLVIFFTGYIFKGIFLGIGLLAAYLLSLFCYDRGLKASPKIIRILSNR